MTKPNFTTAALENINETGTDWEADLARLNSGEVTRDELLAECLDGADADREQGWEDYVQALADERDTRAAYLAEGGTIEFEAQCLSIANEFLPEFARTVRDGGEGSDRYWSWLLEQLHDSRR